MQQQELQHPPHIVIVGAGFGGLQAARAFQRLPVHVTVVDRRNYHLFQPLLYQVATAGLAPSDIASPIRHILRKQTNTDVFMGEATGTDLQNKQLQFVDATTQEIHSLSFDFLIIAKGASENYFGHDEWRSVAPGLKSVEEAINIRGRILLAFEAAELEADLEKRKALLTFVLVGGGPTGVELAGAIAELAQESLSHDFKHINPHEIHIILVEALPRILTAFPERIANKARAKLNQIGVEVRTNSPVEAIEQGSLVIGDQRLSANMIIWTAGIKASDPGHWLGAPTDRAGRVQVEADLSVPGHPDVFIIGDTAHFEQNGKLLPGLAPVAMQQGCYVASVIRRRIEGNQPSCPFHYKDKGNLATVGRSFGIVDIGPIHMTGLIAWLLWLIVHIFFLIGFRNRVATIFQWAWTYFTYERGARLITLDDLSERYKKQKQQPSLSPGGGRTY